MQKYLAKVYVSLKPTVNDPEGLTIRGALVTLGYDSVESVRAGKYFQIEVESASEREASESVEGMCKQLLANPVIEQYEFEIEPRRLKGLAGVAGFEPAAYGFGDRCSTSLSYTPALSPPFDCTAPVRAGSMLCYFAGISSASCLGPTAP